MTNWQSHVWTAFSFRVCHVWRVFAKLFSRLWKAYMSALHVATLTRPDSRSLKTVSRMKLILLKYCSSWGLSLRIWSNVWHVDESIFSDTDTSHSFSVRMSFEETCVCYLYSLFTLAEILSRSCVESPFADSTVLANDDTEETSHTNPACNGYETWGWERKYFAWRSIFKKHLPDASSSSSSFHLLFVDLHPE